MSFPAAPVLQPHGVSSLYHCQYYFLSLRCLPDLSFACQTSTFCPTCCSSIISLLKFVRSLFLYFPILAINKWSVSSSPIISAIISYITYSTWWIDTFTHLFSSFTLKFPSAQFPCLSRSCIPQHLAKCLPHKRCFLNIYWIDGRNGSVFECAIIWITITVVIVVK